MIPMISSQHPLRRATAAALGAAAACVLGALLAACTPPALPILNLKSLAGARRPVPPDRRGSSDDEAAPHPLGDRLGPGHAAELEPCGAQVEIGSVLRDALMPPPASAGGPARTRFMVAGRMRRLTRT